MNSRVLGGLCAIAAFGRGHARVKQGKCRIVDRRCTRQKIELLKDKSDLAISEARKFGRALRCQVFAGNLQRAAGRPIERSDKIHEGRLA